MGHGTTTMQRVRAPEDAPPVGGTRLGKHRLARFGLLAQLERPGQLFENITPNWFAAVMGTGIVAVAAASLPEQFPGLRGAAVAVWALAGLLLLVLGAATTAHWILHPARARQHSDDPAMAHFYGALPMAMLTVGAGTLLVGRDVLGLGTAIDLDWALWLGGTVIGLATAVALPYLTFTRHEVDSRSPFGGWLMPIVPPMVSASTGALLVPCAPAGQVRLSMLVSCYAMFGLSLVISMIVITLIWYRLSVHKTPEARLVPTLWIVLGPLGQSVTAANLLGGVAHLALPPVYANALLAFGVVYGLPVLGFALLWAVVAGAITVRAARRHLPFSLTWWSFTFPVGTCVTGTTGLALHTGSTVLRIAAGVFYAGLVGAWLLVGARTACNAANGQLFVPAPPGAAVPAPRAA